MRGLDPPTLLACLGIPSRFWIAHAGVTALLRHHAAPGWRGVGCSSPSAVAGSRPLPANARSLVPPRGVALVA